MKLEEAKLSLYKYRMKSFIIIIGKGDDAIKHEVIAEMISSIEIVHDYEGFYMPFFSISLTLPNNIYRKVINKENGSNITVKMNLQKGKFKDTLSMDTDTDVTFRDSIKGTFHAIIGPKEQDLSEELQEMAENSDNQYGQITSITMSLYSKDFFDKYDIVVNGILEAVPLMDVMIYCLNKTKIKKMLVSAPDNHKIYSEFRIIPIPLYKQLTRLCDVYAFHKKGSLVYFDLDRGYVIDKTSECTAYEEGEYKVTYIAAATNSQSTQQVGGGYENKEKKYALLNASTIYTSNNSATTKKAIGNNVMAVNAEGKIVKTNKKATKITRVVVENEGENTTGSLKRIINESGSVTTARFQNIDINTLTPNKQFVISVEGTKFKRYNGKYRLSYCVHEFQKEGTYFSVTSVAQFK